MADRTKHRPLAALAVALAVVACAGSAKTIRQVTYPPDFQYLSDEDLSTAMGRMAKDVVALDSALQNPEASRDDYNAELLRILRSMRSTAASLSGKAASTNHPRLDRFLPALIDDIDRAITAAENKSENYFYAGSVIGACEYCHVPRHQPIYRDPIPAE